MAERIDMAPGDLILFGADQPKIVNEALGHLRNHLGKRLGLIDESAFNFAWVTRFPLLEYDETEKRYQAMHHPFTSPLEEDYDLLENDPTAVRSRAYDLVLNGSEIGGGSIRIHRRDLQEKVFSALKMDRETYEEKFGFLLSATRIRRAAPRRDRLRIRPPGDAALRPELHSGRDRLSQNPESRLPADQRPVGAGQGAAGGAVPEVETDRDGRPG
jgi:aspartyl-tRNA synthetase